MSAEMLEFCDTNILVYAYSLSAVQKRARAMELVNRLWDSRSGVLSVQVLQELFVTLTRKSSPPFSPADARSLVSDLSTWRVVEPNRFDVLRAIDISIRWSLSLWDAMLLAAAHKAGASLLWSEGMKGGQVYDGVLVRNPFTEPT